MHYEPEETHKHIVEAGHGSYVKGALIVFSPFILIGTWTMIVLAFGR
jgi:hypothetical protein